MDIPQREHTGPRAGQVTGAVPQPVAVVPRSWLAELARRVGVEWAYAARANVADEDTP